MVNGVCAEVLTARHTKHTKEYKRIYIELPVYDIPDNLTIAFHRLFVNTADRLKFVCLREADRTLWWTLIRNNDGSVQNRNAVNRINGMYSGGVTPHRGCPLG